MSLRRFWFPLEGHIGIGVTADSLDEAMSIAEAARRDLWPDAPSFGPVIPDIDVSTLDQRHIIPNAGPVAVRGMWYPRFNV